MIADRTEYNVPLTGIAVVSIYEYLLIYSFKLKSAFNAYQVLIFTVFGVQTIRLTAKVPEEVKRKCPARNTTVQLNPLYRFMSATVYSVTDRQTDRQTTSSCK